jgi:hypothetical protein
MLVRYFDGAATLEDVRTAASAACHEMRAQGVEPQAMFAEFRGVIRAAAEHAHTQVDTHTLVTVRERLAPWMVDQCFERRATPRYEVHYTTIALQ